jgi:hypothetical protein
LTTEQAGRHISKANKAIQIEYRLWLAPAQDPWRIVILDCTTITQAAIPVQLCVAPVSTEEIVGGTSPPQADQQRNFDAIQAHIVGDHG